MCADSNPLIDALGVHHPVTTQPARIVSLVPSITELLFALELGSQVVGRTHYCIHPAAELANIPSVGGTKKIKQRMLKALKPTHVILNIDENTESMAEHIREYAQIIVTHPLGPQDNPPLYRLLGGIFNREAQAEALCQQFQQTLTALQQNHWPRRQVLYLIWRKPWMTVNRDTYISQTLKLIGFETLPAQSEQRYPTVEINQQLLANTDLVLFSSEPYSFQAQDLAVFAKDYAYPPERLALINGEMTSWYGNRAIAGLEYLRRFNSTIV